MRIENLIRKINEVRKYGCVSFVVKIGGNLYEFKKIKVANHEYVVFDGAGIALRTFSNHNSITSETIVNEFVVAIRGMDLSISDAIFTDPMSFV